MRRGEFPGQQKACCPGRDNGYTLAVPAKPAPNQLATGGAVHTIKWVRLQPDPSFHLPTPSIIRAYVPATFASPPGRALRALRSRSRSRRPGPRPRVQTEFHIQACRPPFRRRHPRADPAGTCGHRDTQGPAKAARLASGAPAPPECQDRARKVQGNWSFV